MRHTNDPVADVLATMTPETLHRETLDRQIIEKLRRAQQEVLDRRWEARLEDLRARAPFRNLPVLEQNRAIHRLGA